MSDLELQVGRTYRAKRPAAAGSLFSPLVNDRTVVWVGSTTVQYDGPSVAFGRKRPIVSIEQFKKWASRDVTDELPPNEYAAWTVNKG